MKETLPKEQCGMLKILYLHCFLSFFFSCFHCVSWIMPIEYCFLCWLFLLSIVCFFSLYPKKVVIQNSERHAEHIAACGLDAAQVSSSV